MYVYAWLYIFLLILQHSFSKIIKKINNINTYEYETDLKHGDSHVSAIEEYDEYKDCFTSDGGYVNRCLDEHSDFTYVRLRGIIPFVKYAVKTIKQLFRRKPLKRLFSRRRSAVARKLPRKPYYRTKPPVRSKEEIKID